MKYYIKKPQYSPVTLKEEWYYLQEQQGSIWGLGKEKAAVFSEEGAKGWLKIMGSKDMKLEPIQACPEGKIEIDSDGGSRPDLDMDEKVRIDENRRPDKEMRNVVAQFETGPIPTGRTVPKPFLRATASEVHEGRAYKRQEILKKALSDVSTERQNMYGSPEDNFATIANFWNDYIRARGISDPSRPLIQPKDVAVMMIAVKMSRIVTSPNHDDNWSDIAGYAACGGEIKQ